MSFEDLLLVLILLAPLLSRLFRKRQPQPPRVPQPSREIEHPLGSEPALEAAEEDPFSEALRQIRESLGQPAPPPPLPPSPPPAAEPPPAAKAPPRPATRPRPTPPRRPKLDGLGAPITAPPEPRRPLPRPRAAEPSTEALHRDVRAMLRDPNRARAAFMIQQILGPPPGLARRR